MVAKKIMVMVARKINFVFTALINFYSGHLGAVDLRTHRPTKSYTYVLLSTYVAAINLRTKRRQ